MLDYRTRIYREYATLIQDANDVFDETKAAHYVSVYDTHFKGWLPENKDAAILDVASGDGRLLFFFKSRGFTKLKGVDLSAEQVALSRQVIENIDEEDAVVFLEKHKLTFDLIVGMDILEHLKKEEALNFLDACHGAIKPGGRIILQTPNAESPMGMMVRYGDFTHEIALTSNSLERLMSLCGFSDIESRETGPVIHGVASLARYLIWKAIRTGLILWNLAETGERGSGILTRVFLISGRK